MNHGPTTDSYQHSWPLASLRERDLALLNPNFHPIELRLGDILARAGEETDAVYFPLRSIISTIVVMEDGKSVESSMTGREGIVGAVSALGSGCSLGECLVQGAGPALRLDRHHLQGAVDKSAAIRQMVNRSTEVLMFFSQQSLACINYHPIEARFCRWILTARDQLQSDELPLTQEFMAEMLGCQRTSVTLTAHTLQTAGLIKTQRGKIQILDPAAVEEASCECYRQVRGRMQRAFPAQA